MKSKILIAFLLLTGFSAICSCSRELKRCNLTEAQKELIPYEKGQTISFLDKSGQTVNLTVIKSELGWEQDRQGSGFKVDYISCRYISVKLESEPNNFDISLYLKAGDCLSGNDYCSLEIWIPPSPHQGYFVFSSDLEGNLSHNQYFHDSIKINNKVYYDVVECEFLRIYWSIDEPEISMQLYYNKMYGILQIIRDVENFLTINN